MPGPTHIDPTAVYVVAEVAELARSDRRVIWRAIEDGNLKAFVPNGCKKGRRILGQWVLDWMEKGAERLQDADEVPTAC